MHIISTQTVHTLTAGGRHTPQCPPASPRTCQRRAPTSRPQPRAPASITRRSGPPPPPRGHPVRSGGTEEGMSLKWSLCSGQNTSDQSSLKRTLVTDSSTICTGKRDSLRLLACIAYKSVDAKLGFSIRQFLILTGHSVTLSNISPGMTIESLAACLGVALLLSHAGLHDLQHLALPQRLPRSGCGVRNSLFWTGIIFALRYFLFGWKKTVVMDVGGEHCH